MGSVILIVCDAATKDRRERPPLARPVERDGHIRIPSRIERRSMAAVRRRAIDTHFALKLSALHSAYATLHSLHTKTLSVFGLPGPLTQPPSENSRWCGNRLRSVSADGEPGPGR